MNYGELISHLAQLWREEWQALLDSPADLGFLFLSGFPLLLSVLWSGSAIISLVRSAGKEARASRVVQRPSFSVLVPYFGNPDEAVRTAWSVADVTPQPDEIVLIDDGSPPDAGALDLSKLPSGTRVIRHEVNQGKAAALRSALPSVKSDIIVCLDADTLAETNDWSAMLEKFAMTPRLGALTGNIRPRRVRSFIQILQAIDYLAVICLVKCAETLWGGLMTVSGAWVAYRREALVECGGWSDGTCAEDIDLSWRMQGRGWRILYERSWIARVEMTRSWRALWLQRRRWSSGLTRALCEQIGGAVHRGAPHLPVALVASLCAIWMWTCAGVVACSTVAVLMNGDAGEIFGTLVAVIRDHALALSICLLAFMIQAGAGILVDHGARRRYPLLLLLAPFYVIYFWTVLFTSYIAGFVRGIRRLDAARWTPTAINETTPHVGETVFAHPRNPSPALPRPTTLSIMKP
jgi:biofilm PGA synthesis N-glycosyltransferase PgaC